jgi:hypothetical protein
MAGRDEHLHALAVFQTPGYETFKTISIADCQELYGDLPNQAEDADPQGILWNQDLDEYFELSERIWKRDMEIINIGLRLETLIEGDDQSVIESESEDSAEEWTEEEKNKPRLPPSKAICQTISRE